MEKRRRPLLVLYQAGLRDAALALAQKEGANAVLALPQKVLALPQKEGSYTRHQGDVAWVDAAVSQEPEALVLVQKAWSRTKRRGDMALVLVQKAWSRTKRRGDVALEKAWADVTSSHEPYM